MPIFYSLFQDQLFTTALLVCNCHWAMDALSVIVVKWWSYIDNSFFLSRYCVIAICYTNTDDCLRGTIVMAIKGNGNTIRGSSLKLPFFNFDSLTYNHGSLNSYSFLQLWSSTTTSSNHNVSYCCLLFISPAYHYCPWRGGTPFKPIKSIHAMPQNSYPRTNI